MKVLPAGLGGWMDQFDSETQRLRQKMIRSIVEAQPTTQADVIAEIFRVAQSWNYQVTMRLDSGVIWVEVGFMSRFEEDLPSPASWSEPLLLISVEVEAAMEAQKGASPGATAGRASGTKTSPKRKSS